MSNEPLGLYEELAANRAKYAWKEYIPPHDRLERHAARDRIAARRLEPRPKKRLGLGPRSSLTTRAEQVVRAFCKTFEVGVDGVLSHGRSRKLARPRQAAMHFLHVEMAMTTTPLGRMMNRDHTTVIHAVQVVSNLLRCDSDFSARYHRAVRALRAIWTE
jgi:hypothetical protein